MVVESGNEWYIEKNHLNWGLPFKFSANGTKLLFVCALWFTLILIAVDRLNLAIVGIFQTHLLTSASTTRADAPQQQLFMWRIFPRNTENSCTVFYRQANMLQIHTHTHIRCYSDPFAAIHCIICSSLRLLYFTFTLTCALTRPRHAHRASHRPSPSPFLRLHPPQIARRLHWTFSSPEICNSRLCVRFCFDLINWWWNNRQAKQTNEEQSQMAWRSKAKGLYSV